MRIGVVDIGTNSTRLLIADVDANGRVDEQVRITTITRLGQGVDDTGTLQEEAMARVFAALDGYAKRIEAAGCRDDDRRADQRGARREQRRRLHRGGPRALRDRRADAGRRR